MNPSSSLHVRAALLVLVVTAAALLSTVPSFERMALTVVVAAAGLLGWLLIRQARDAAKQQSGSHELRRRTVELESQVQAGLADARASGERLRTIIDWVFTIAGAIAIAVRGW